MIHLTIDEKPVEVAEGTTIINAAKSVGIEIPTLCYLEEVSRIAACRVCVVEVEGAERLVTSCNTVVREGMVVHTASERVKSARKVVVDLIRSQHEMNCGECVRNQTCKLQKLGREYGVLTSRYRKEVKQKDWDESFPLIRRESKCIKCMRCVQMCNNIQTVGIWDYVNSGGRTTVGVSGGRTIADSNCTVCGQCIMVCPVGALYERDDTAGVIAALDDPDRIAVAQINGTVAAAWAKAVRLPDSVTPVAALTQALHMAGFKYVFDMDVSVAVSIRESALEIKSIIESGDPNRFPLLSSGCPSWVRFVKGNYPGMTRCLSTVRSAQQIFGVLVKNDLAASLGVQREDIFCVNFTACLSSKAECALEVNSVDGSPDVDTAITTRELIRIIRAKRINPFSLDGEPCDNFEDFDTLEAPVSLKRFGGSLEASVRTLYSIETGEPSPADLVRVVSHADNVIEYAFTLGGVDYIGAAVTTLGAASKLLQEVRSGRKLYHFIEVLACGDGCEGGGGQPLAEDGARHVRTVDQTEFNLSDSDLAHFSAGREGLDLIYVRNENIREKLHTDHSAWKLPLSLSLARNTLISNGEFGGE